MPVLGVTFVLFLEFGPHLTVIDDAIAGRNLAEQMNLEAAPETLTGLVVVRALRQHGMLKLVAHGRSLILNYRG